MSERADDSGASAPSSQTFQVTDIQPAQGGLYPGSYPTITPDGLWAIWVPGNNDRRYRNRRAAWPCRAMLTRTPRGPLSPEARCVAEYTPHPPTSGWVGGVCTGWCTPRARRAGWWGGVVQYPTPPHLPTVGGVGMGLWAQRPRGARRCMEYPGIHGNTRNTREYRNTRGYRDNREYRDTREYR